MLEQASLMSASVLILSLALTAAASAAILRVDPSVQGGTGDGASWADAYPHLQDALAAAQPGDELWLAKGVHLPDQGAEQVEDDPASSFHISKALALYGGFVGTERTRQERDPGIHRTILSGDIDQNDLNADGNFVAEDESQVVGTNARNVVSISEVEAVVVLDGLVVTAGFSSELSGPAAGVNCPHLRASTLVLHDHRKHNPPWRRRNRLFLRTPDFYRFLPLRREPIRNRRRRLHRGHLLGGSLELKV